LQVTLAKLPAWSAPDRVTDRFPKVDVGATAEIWADAGPDTWSARVPVTTAFGVPIKKEGGELHVTVGGVVSIFKDMLTGTSWSPKEFWLDA
jgi:hypothetical protein